MGRQEVAAEYDAGWSALAAGKPEKAHRIFFGLKEAWPGRPGIWIGLARAALALQQPEEALRLAEEAKERSTSVNPAWFAIRALAHLALREPGEAEAALREWIAFMPSAWEPHWRLMNLMSQTFRQEEAMAWLQECAPRFATHDALPGLRVQLLISLHRLREAASVAREAIPQMVSATGLVHLFPLLPRLFGEHESCVAVWRSMRMRLDALEGQAGRDDLSGALSVRLRFALGEYSAFGDEAQALLSGGRAGTLAIPLRDTLRGRAVSQVDARQQSKVFVVGLSKTGATSLTVALSQLGYISHHWSNPLTYRMLRAHDADLYDILSDIRVVDLLSELPERYPQARFILSTRRCTNWVEVMRRHYHRLHGTVDFNALRGLQHYPLTLNQCERIVL